MGAEASVSIITAIFAVQRWLIDAIVVRWCDHIRQCCSGQVDQLINRFGRMIEIPIP